MWVLNVELFYGKEVIGVTSFFWYLYVMCSFIGFQVLGLI